MTTPKTAREVLMSLRCSEYPEQCKYCASEQLFCKDIVSKALSELAELVSVEEIFSILSERKYWCPSKSEQYRRQSKAIHALITTKLGGKDEFKS